MWVNIAVTSCSLWGKRAAREGSEMGSIARLRPRKSHLLFGPLLNMLPATDNPNVAMVSLYAAQKVSGFFLHYSFVGFKNLFYVFRCQFKPLAYAMDAYCAMSTFHVENLGEYLAPHLCPKQEKRPKNAEHVLLCPSFFKKIKICPRMRQTEGDTFGASHSYFCPRPKNLSCSPSSPPPPVISLSSA